MKKGFTLIELLGVLVILSAIIAIAVPAVNHVIKNAKNSLSKTQIKNIESAAKQYYLSEGNDSTTCVNLSYLIENDYFNDSKISEESIKKGSVQITYNGNQYNYEYQEKTCGICQVIEGSGNSIGDKLECEVKPGTKYNFYILSRNDDETINLIMDRNVYYNSDSDKGLVDDNNNGYTKWYATSSNNSYGPVTAMAYLHNATKDWINIPNIVMNYTDVESYYGYGGIYTTGTETLIIKNDNTTVSHRIEGLKSRLPIYDEIHSEDLCLTYYENGNKDGSCPLWLRGANYWLLSSYAPHSEFAWGVSLNGSLVNTYVSYDHYRGVRPVITIKKDDINPYNPPSVICKTVTEDTVTTGNVPEDNYEPGDEYICEVKPGTRYHFFVISEEDDNVNLIMDRNVYYNSDDDNGTVTDDNSGLVEWISEEDYNDDINYGVFGKNDKGPVTAMKYLHNATKDWINIPNIVLDYKDENIHMDTLKPENQYGYGSIKTENNITKIMMKDGTITNGDGYTNLKARLPRFDELHAKCEAYYDDDSAFGSCPLWLVNYFADDGWGEYYPLEEGKKFVNDVWGYWVISSDDYDDNSAWSIYTCGILLGGNAVSDFENYGVRPVISIPKNRIK